jgi:heterodisulfide reductase subunit A-like polyferredoxin
MSCTSVFDEDGAFNPTYDETDLITVEADTVIIAIGQIADLSFAEKLGIPVTIDGCFQADPVSLQTSLEAVFVGGDVYSGPATIAEAIGTGKQAAISIDRYIKGWDLRIGRLGQDKEWKVITEPQKKIYDSASRAQMPALSIQERINSFDEIQSGFSADMALQEANRCLMCGASCVQACPYDVMQFDHITYKAVKCDLCADRRARGLAPACSLVCHTRCIYWGDAENIPDGVEIVL